jgi:putative FmdB family regulatory protein
MFKKKEEREMPIYEYQCRGCGQSFEKLQKMDEGKKTIKCPHCGQEKAERVLSDFCCSKSSESPSSSCGSAGKSKRFS